MSADAWSAIDELDARLIGLLSAEPRIGILEASRRLGVARGTVQARLDRMQARGVITGYGPDIDPEALGHLVSAFVTLELRQVGGHERKDQDHGDHQDHSLGRAAQVHRLGEVRDRDPTQGVAGNSEAGNEFDPGASLGSRES